MRRHLGKWSYHGTRFDLNQIAEEGLLPQKTFVYSHGGWVDALWITDREDWASSHGAVLRFPPPADAEFTPDSDSFLTFKKVPPQDIEVEWWEGRRKKWLPIREAHPPRKRGRYA
jgi:hypothetical protein